MKTEQAKGQLIVRCKGAELVNYRELAPLQGKLKAISAQDFDKLKSSLLTRGIRFPFFYWKNGVKKFVLDGHHRGLALAQLEKEGWKVPLVPACPIEARNEKEARELILLATAQYATIDPLGLKDFIASQEIDLLALPIVLPGINLEEFVATFIDGATLPPTFPKVDPHDLETSHKCPKCGFEF